MSEQSEPVLSEDEIARSMLAFNQAVIEACRAIWDALQPTIAAFGAWYASLSPELQAALSGRPLNRRQPVARKKLRQMQLLKAAAGPRGAIRVRGSNPAIITDPYLGDVVHTSHGWSLVETRARSGEW